MHYLLKIFKLIKKDWRENFPIVKKEDKSEFLQTISFENIRRLKYISFFTLLIISAYTIVDLSLPEFSMYLSSDISMLIFVSTSIGVYIKQAPNSISQINWKHVYHVNLFSTGLLVWSAYVASFEIEENGYIYSYLLSIFLVSVIFYIRRKELLIIYFLGFLAFSLSNFYNYGFLLPKTKVIYVLLTHLFCWILSRLQFAARTHNYMVNKQLSDTNELLSVEIASRVQAENELLSLAHNLEIRVNERTQELQEINIKLEKEIDHHKKTSEALLNSKQKLNRQNNKLVQLNEELDMFVYRTSHDIRGPISSVLGLLLLLRNESNKELFHFLLDKIEGSMNKLDGFINDINDFSDNSRLRIRKSQINFQEVLEDILQKLKPYDVNNEIETNIIVNNPHPFYTDEKRLRLILKCILENAFIYQMKNNPKKTINIGIDTTVNEKNALITIEDNGTGIESSILDKVFEMFYRGNSLSKGSGLGLYVAKMAAQKIGGVINIKSEEGKFTKVKVNIPCILKTEPEESLLSEEIEDLNI